MYRNGDATPPANPIVSMIVKPEQAQAMQKEPNGAD